MSLKRDYWKWRVGAGRRGTLRRAGRRSGNGFEAMGACMAMLDHARRESHWIDNPEGAFTTTLDDLATDYCTPIVRVRESLGALVASGWLSVSPEVASAGEEDDLTVRVNKYLDFNYPQGSDADRKAAERLRKADAERDAAVGKRRDLQVVVTGCHEASVESPEERREEREGEGVSVVPEGTTSSAKRVGEPRAPKDPDKIADKATVDGCWEWYCDLWNRRGARAIDFDGERRRQIERAIRKHGKTIVTRVIRYYHANDWRHGALDRHDIKVLLREKNIKAALEGMQDATPASQRGGEFGAMFAKLNQMTGAGS